MDNPEQTAAYSNLLADEDLVSSTVVVDVLPDRLPSGILELERLDQASSERDIGKRPVLAALPLSSHEDDPNFHVYEAVFGRDSLRVVSDLIDRYPELARSTLVALAEKQGVEYNTEREEEPGRIPHEVRDPVVDSRARQLTNELGWGWPYYGAVDTTPEFVRTLSQYCRKTADGQEFLQNMSYLGRDNQTHSMRDAFDAAINWMFMRLDANKEGLIEFKHVNPMGIENQVWRDSWDSYFHTDGEIADHSQGVASVDVQRVAYDALLDAADIYESYLHDPGRVEDLRARAERLRRQIMDIFWSDEKGGYFVLGTDRDQSGNLRQLKIRTSDMGHLLHSRLLEGDDQEISRRREATVRQLFSPEMMGLNGIRSLASDEVRYRPGAYHNGSVWIWNNYLIAQGLVSHGYDRLADYVATKLLDDAQITRRFPEYLRGDNDLEHRLNTTRVVVYDRRYKRLNVVEQPPQDIQAWSVAAILSIKLQNGKRSSSAQPDVQTDSSQNFEDEILSNAA